MKNEKMKNEKKACNHAKGISLLDLQKALLKAQQEKIKEVKGGVLVAEIPLSNAGFYKEDKHYITADALYINSVDVLNSCLR